MGAISVQSKQSSIGQKFSQSGHTAWDMYVGKKVLEYVLRNDAPDLCYAVETFKAKQ
jgi:hypothetical protein